jgi:hypothetical protein
MEDDTPDWAMAKAVQDEMIGVPEETEVKFKFLTDGQHKIIAE